MARIVLQGFGARMATFDGGKSELAGATLERVLTAGVYDRRWHALVPYLRRLSRAGSMCGALSTSTVGAYVRLVPKADICSAAKCVAIRSPRRRGRVPTMEFRTRAPSQS